MGEGTGFGRFRWFIVWTILLTLLILALPRPAAGVEADDDIPGVQPPSSPLSGSLDLLADAHDVFRIVLQPGQTLDATVSGVAGVDCDLHLYAPHSSSVAATAPIVSAASPDNPETLHFTVPSDSAGPDTYYLDVRCASGSGGYVLEHALNAVLDCVPTQLNMIGTVGGRDPADAAVSISNLGAGAMQWASSDNASWLTLSATSGVSPSSLYAHAHTERMSAGSRLATITVASPGAGRAPASVRVKLAMLIPTCVRISIAPSAISCGSACTLVAVSRIGWYGRATDPRDRYAPLLVQYMPKGESAWKDLKTATTNRYGVAYIRIAPQVNTYYRVVRLRNWRYQSDFSSSDFLYVRYRILFNMPTHYLRAYSEARGLATFYPVATSSGRPAYLQYRFPGGLWRTGVSGTVPSSGIITVSLIGNGRGSCSFRLYTPSSFTNLGGYSNIETLVWY